MAFEYRALMDCSTSDDTALALVMAADLAGQPILLGDEREHRSHRSG